MPADLYRSPIPEQLWERIRNEFHLPSLEQVRERSATVHEDPEPVMQQLVRIFLDGGTYCPGYQFQTDLTFEPVVLQLYERAMELRIPHNYGAVIRQIGTKFLDGSCIANFIFDHNTARQENFDYVPATDDAHLIFASYPLGPLAALGDTPKFRGYLTFAGSDRQKDVPVEIITA